MGGEREERALRKDQGAFGKTTLPTSEPSGQKSTQEKPQIWDPRPPAAAPFYPCSAEKMGLIREPLLQMPALLDGGWEGGSSTRASGSRASPVSTPHAP